MDEGSIAALKADLGEEDGLWPEHVPIMHAFMLCETQWRGATMSDGFAARIHYVGLDYSACRVALDLAGIDVDQDLWAGITAMELFALNTLNEVRP